MTEMSFAISKFIEDSKTLVHINLSACGIEGEQAVGVFMSVKKSKSI
jgi:hypothetical protein